MPKPVPKCHCEHRREVHNEARRGLPAYCGVCTGARALHPFREAVSEECDVIGILTELVSLTSRSYSR